jgi:hypothetical protein
MLSVKKNAYVLAGCLSAALFFSACGSNNSSSNANVSTTQTNNPTNLLGADSSNLTNEPFQLAVRPPFNKVDVSFQKYKASGQKATILEISSGTKIEIPANCFVDKNGKAITEDIEISYREFHNAADIITSGIPIQDADGKYMETAGMFEIAGSLGGEEVFVADNKEIKVKMASFNEGDRFDFFKMQPKNCKWDEIDGEGKIKAIPNVEKKVKMKEIEIQIAENIAPLKSKAADKNKFAFDLDVNYEAFPELSGFKGVVWEYAGNKDEDNPEKQTWVMKTDWDDVRLKSENGSYKLVLTNKTKSFETTVRPILSKEDQSKVLAEFDKKMKVYEEEKKILELQKASLKTQADVYRAIAIDGFGVYNWDCIHNPERVSCETSFVIADYPAEKIQNITLFLVSKKQKAVIQFNGQYGKIPSFSFNPDDENMLIAVLANNQVATISADFFKKINIQKLQKNSKLEFPFQINSSVIKSVADVQKIIEQLS